MHRLWCSTAAILLCSLRAAAQVGNVDPARIKAHEVFLASDALQGRGSATRDEHIAAVYVASQFESFRLQPPPKMDTFVQEIGLVQPSLNGHATISARHLSLTEGTDFRVLSTSGQTLAGPLVSLNSSALDNLHLRKGDAALLNVGNRDRKEVRAAIRKVRNAGAQLVFLFGGATLAQQFPGDSPDLPLLFADGTPMDGSGGEPRATVLLTSRAAQQFTAIGNAGKVELTFHSAAPLTKSTYNAVGFLRGSDAHAGTLLLTAHLDHLGVKDPVQGDAIYNGADDDASGTAAVLELARVLASGPRPKRSILFVCFGSEELGAYGSTWFRQHTPVPLDQIAANVEFEMIGAQDPKMPKGTLLFTGWERSNLGPALRQHGAKLGPDPYPEQHFFQRSDNYALALKGVVAHTAAGYGSPPYYHRPDDDLAHLDLGFMTSAIQSLIEPIRWLANSNFRPQWNPGQKP